MEERERTSVNSESKEAATSRPQQDPAAAANPGGDGDTNVCSDSFDPLLALYCPAAPRLPFPNIKCFNNVAEYESFLKGGRGRAKPENVEKKQRKATRGAADPQRIERLRRLMVNNPAPAEGEAGSRVPARRRNRVQKNVLTRMALCKGSPLGQLHRCIEERIRVKVHIRSFKGLRGVCSGFIVAFDKFWNMAMVDVDETYREPLFGQAFYHEKALTISRLFEKLNLQEGSGGNEPVERQESQEKVGQHQPTNPKAAGKSGSAQPANVKGDGRAAELKLSQAVKREAQKVSLQDQDSQEKQPQPYGKVRTRHINQLFIRGENVILVNPQPL
ncbi:U7 snRNA-associated Sm-like protein LSm11 [Cololabis saira]|uniref:U7 snRNA-associated Sm-like protein LSm11 n=1 Tax=Cololabis saira TaxID=129043 RepID=UPI002AD4DFA8|nr:U7 snRNA-associated Sm-like protein LSm11 [Cololabis saira]